MKLHSSKVARLTCTLLVIWTSLCGGLQMQAQNDPIERTFSQSRPDIEKAVAMAKETFHGKLPVLEGFVGQVPNAVERYERSYYQCLFRVIPSMSGETSVRVTAKITSWYNDPDKQKSGYEVLVSNGRLENDALDRIQEILDGDSTSAVKSNTQPGAKYNLSIGSAMPHGGPIVPSALKDSRPPTAMVAPGVVTEEEIQNLRQRRIAAEKRVQQLNTALQNLQELYDARAKPNDLVAITKTGTAVYGKPEQESKPLLIAIAKDQFQMIEIKGEWVHVQIAGQSRGWIRKSQIEFPDDSSDAQQAVSTNAAKPAELFRITGETTETFPGTWEALRGKTVKVYSVQPTQAPTFETSGRAKRAYANELFSKAWEQQSAGGAPASGVVVVFDSADGGQASTTMESLQAWREGKLSEAAFWQACVLDPPETFSLISKRP